MISGVRGFSLVVAAILLMAVAITQTSMAADSNPREFAANTPPPASSIELNLDQSNNPAVQDGKKTFAKVEEVSILPVPLPPALLCLLTAFAGLAVLGRRRGGIA